MSYEVTLTPEAKRDLREIYRYIAVDLQSEQNAGGQLDRLEENILKLDEMPERFRVYDREPWRSWNRRFCLPQQRTGRLYRLPAGSFKYCHDPFWY